MRYPTGRQKSTAKNTAWCNQVYTHPKYREYGKKFFAGVDKRYTEYAKQLEGKLGIPYQKLTGLIYILVRACVHYALFEDEFYLQSQLKVLKESIELSLMKYNPKARVGCYFGIG